MPPVPYINRIGTAVPPYDVHRKFIDYAPSLLGDERMRSLFKRAAERSGIGHRYSFFEPDGDSRHLDKGRVYRRGLFPKTQDRMQLYERFALPLACNAINALGNIEDVTHIIITSCTGFYAPGLDWQIIEHYGLNRSVERFIIGFMGCYAAVNGLKTAFHIVRSQPDAVVLLLNIELCTLHLQEMQNLEQLLSFLIFADGCAASLISAKATGIGMQRFYSTVLTDSASLITWHIGNSGFDMHLSGQVPGFIQRHLAEHAPSMLPPLEKTIHWAIHPGGRSILDAVQKSLHLQDSQMTPSRSVLHDYGNMSSPTIMFVLKALLDAKRPGPGCVLAFGPGLSVETMQFTV